MGGGEPRLIGVLPTGDSLQMQEHTQTESELMEKIFHTNENQKKARAAILISYKIDFRIKRKRRQLHKDKGINPTRHL